MTKQQEKFSKNVSCLVKRKAQNEDLKQKLDFSEFKLGKPTVILDWI